ncbi:MAG: hypothetical protein ACUVTQ_02560 [Desulfotomaculales bacterium]
MEAMRAHRPYRPALPLGAALQELSAGRGVLYDARVVDAALALGEQVWSVMENVFIVGGWGLNWKKAGCASCNRRW